MADITGQANDTFNKSKLGDITELQDYYDALNELEKQNKHLHAFDTGVMDSNGNDLQSGIDRWPTLFEILNKKTQSPLDLWSFYVFMRDEQNAIDYLDFWIDTVQHINLCKAYVKTLRDSLAANSRIRQAERVTDVLNSNTKDINNETSNNPNETKISIVDDIKPPHTSFSMDNLDNIVSGGRNNHPNRNSQNSSRNSRSSSQLLDLLMKNDMFESEDPHRLSLFLRGETAIRTSDPLVNAKLDELKRRSQSFINTSGNNFNNNNDTAPTIINDFSSEQDLTDLNNKTNLRTSRINPEMVETFIQYDIDAKQRDFNKSHLIGRSELRKSTNSILTTYFLDNSEKKIQLPPSIVEKVKYALETEGRDDPEVFDEAREFVFKSMEFDAYPNFLRNHALKNVTRKSAMIRLLLSMICALGAFWAGYTLIFMDYEPKPTRAVVVIPFFFMSYLFFSSFYRIDPFLCFAGYGESIATHGGLIQLREKYVRSILQKRSIFVLTILCLVAAAFSIIFALVPGHRLQHS
ncbi:Rax1 protein [Pichia kluyveri]|uniref:Rax1 protein n=1 Tax=Pichia kluyveri TaxID=36015 RepID=A0AAV5R0E5_PICKL|nr:Rax1 protein [Pichia kluyveri]